MEDDQHTADRKMTLRVKEVKKSNRNIVNKNKTFANRRTKNNRTTHIQQLEVKTRSDRNGQRTRAAGDHAGVGDRIVAQPAKDGGAGLPRQPHGLAGAGGLLHLAILAQGALELVDEALDLPAELPVGVVAHRGLQQPHEIRGRRHEKRVRVGISFGRHRLRAPLSILLLARGIQRRKFGVLKFPQGGAVGSQIELRQRQVDSNVGRVLHGVAERRLPGEVGIQRVDVDTEVVLDMGRVGLTAQQVHVF